MMFQHTAARRRLALFGLFISFSYKFQHTAARRRLGLPLLGFARLLSVSTHSRPKAAGGRNDWRKWSKWFQHTAARRRLGLRK